MPLSGASSSCTTKELIVLSARLLTHRKSQRKAALWPGSVKERKDMPAPGGVPHGDADRKAAISAAGPG